MVCASSAPALNALRSMLIAPCHLREGKSALLPRQPGPQQSPCHTQFYAITSAEVARVDAVPGNSADTLALSAEFSRVRAMQLCQADSSSAGAATASAAAADGANAARAPRLSAVTCAARRLASAICR